MVLTPGIHAQTTTADDAGASRQDDAADDSPWRVQLGLLGLVSPEFEGGDEYEGSALPIIDIEWNRRLFLNTRRGLGGYFVNNDWFQAGASVGYRFGRDQDDADVLRGLGDVDGGATANLFATYTFGRASLGGQLSQDISGNDTGLTLDLEAGMRFAVMPELTLSPTLQTTFASSDYMESYFGVTPAQSARSGLQTYDADAGLKSVGVGVNAAYSVTRRVSVLGNIGYKRLLDEAADSPIVEDADQFRVGLGLSYRF